MIHIVTRGNSAFYQRELSRFFELRREIFVEERGWHLATTGGEERDEYDDDQAV
ncbi:acyl-homoserine-lactone synthase, partial [Escherichia coli]